MDCGTSMCENLATCEIELYTGEIVAACDIHKLAGTEV